MGVIRKSQGSWRKHTSVLGMSVDKSVWGQETEPGAIHSTAQRDVDLQNNTTATTLSTLLCVACFMLCCVCTCVCKVAISAHCQLPVQLCHLCRREARNTVRFSDLLRASNLISHQWKRLEGRTYKTMHTNWMIWDSIYTSRLVRFS